MTPARAPATTLRREIGVGTGALMVVGGIIGSGIFFTPAEVARALPNAQWIIGVWVLGGVIAFAGALTYAELGAMLPDAGGAYVYTREAFGRLPAFLNGWMTVLLVASGAIAAVAMGFAGYLERFVALDALGGRLGVAAVTIILLSATNYVGLRPGVTLLNVLTAAKIVALAVLIAGGLVAWVALHDPASVPTAPPPPASRLSGFATAFVAVLFTIGGWQQLNMVAGEIKEPQRVIPRALLAGIAIVVAIYLGANAVYLRTLGRDGLAASTAVAADAMQRMVGGFGATFIAVSAMLSILGFLNVAIIANSRIPYALAADGAFFRVAARVHPRFGTPHVAIALLGAWSLVLLFASGGRIGDLLSGVVFADWIFFGLGAASVFALRRRFPDMARPYRVPGYPVLPALFVAASAVGVASAYLAAPRTSAFGTVLLLVGVVVFRLLERRPR
ncbi:MAG: amino acid permease [Gemmatimonadetes bacterium]|nr:amino acid permease [Gemmatimonadota bacterium]